MPKVPDCELKKSYLSRDKPLLEYRVEEREDRVRNKIEFLETGWI